jgi:hypothetical protein
MSTLKLPVPEGSGITTAIGASTERTHREPGLQGMTPVVPDPTRAGQVGKVS